MAQKIIQLSEKKMAFQILLKWNIKASHREHLKNYRILMFYILANFRKVSINSIGRKWHSKYFSGAAGTKKS